MEEDGRSGWMPPKKIVDFPSAEEIKILSKYPANYSNKTENPTYSVSLINTTRQNFIPNINYAALLDSSIIEQIDLLLGQIEESDFSANSKSDSQQ